MGNIRETVAIPEYPDSVLRKDPGTLNSVELASYLLSIGDAYDEETTPIVDFTGYTPEIRSDGRVVFWRTFYADYHPVQLYRAADPDMFATIPSKAGSYAESTLAYAVSFLDPDGNSVNLLIPVVNGDSVSIERLIIDREKFSLLPPKGLNARWLNESVILQRRKKEGSALPSNLEMILRYPGRVAEIFNAVYLLSSLQKQVDSSSERGSSGIPRRGVRNTVRANEERSNREIKSAENNLRLALIYSGTTRTDQQAVDEFIKYIRSLAVFLADENYSRYGSPFRVPPVDESTKDESTKDEAISPVESPLIDAPADTPSANDSPFREGSKDGRYGLMQRETLRLRILLIILGSPLKGDDNKLGPLMRELSDLEGEFAPSQG